MPEPDVPPEAWDKSASELARQKAAGHDRRERRALRIVAVAAPVLADPNAEDHAAFGAAIDSGRVSVAQKEG